MGPLAPSSVSSNQRNYMQNDSPNYVGSVGSWVDQSIQSTQKVNQQKVSTQKVNTSDLNIQQSMFQTLDQKGTPSTTLNINDLYRQYAVRTSAAAKSNKAVPLKPSVMHHRAISVVEP